MQSTKTEKLLNDIYSEPDLKGDVFEYLNPFVLKAYNLLKIDGRENVTVFSTPDDKRKIENILSYELPDLIDTYKKMPLEYRNEKVLRSGKTARETLINSIQMLTHTIKKIEENGMTDNDKDLLVKNRAIREKYQVEHLTETDYQEDFKSNFSWTKFKPTLPVLSNTSNTSFNSDVNFFEKDSNKKIELVEGEIQYKVKDKFKAFMKGTYQAATHAAQTTQKFVKNNKGLVILVSVVSLVVGGVTYMVHTSHVALQPKNDIEKINQLTTDLANNPTPYMKNMTLVLLNNFAKENPRVHLTYNQDKSLVDIQEKLVQKDCSYTIDMMHFDHETHKLPYRINGEALDSRYEMSDDAKNIFCAMPENTISASFELRDKKVAQKLTN